MSKSEVLGLIEYLHAWGTDHGVIWSDIAYDGYRELQEQAI